MNRYKHTQIATLILVLLGVIMMGIISVIVIAPETRMVAIPVLAVLMLVTVLFFKLTVEVTADEIVVAFGPGIIRRSIRITDIRDARVVRNKWYYGWGIRLIPHGWMFNVSGFDAVELDFDGGRKFRIGTDDPEGLLAAIQRNAGKLERGSGALR